MRVDVSQVPTCPLLNNSGVACGAPLDAYGYHAQVCNRTHTLRFKTSNKLRDALLHQVQSLGFFGYPKEPHLDAFFTAKPAYLVHLATTGKPRRGDLAYRDPQGRKRVIDVTITSAAKQDTKSSEGKGHAAKLSEQRKVKELEDDFTPSSAEQGYATFTPVALESSGGYGQRTFDLFVSIAVAKYPGEMLKDLRAQAFHNLSIACTRPVHDCYAEITQRLIHAAKSQVAGKIFQAQANAVLNSMNTGQDQLPLVAPSAPLVVVV